VVWRMAGKAGPSMNVQMAAAAFTTGQILANLEDSTNRSC
jgi:hypothetical protein